MKVKNIGSNQTEIEVGEKTVLVSYETPVACHIQGEGYYRTEEKFSVTTSRHINKWLASNGAHEVTEKPQEFFDKLLT